MELKEEINNFAKAYSSVESRDDFNKIHPYEIDAFKTGANFILDKLRWKDPKEELPEINSRVLLKSETGYVETRTIRNWHILGNSLSLILGGKKVIGWRPIE